MHICIYVSVPPVGCVVVCLDVSGDRGLRLVSIQQFGESEDTSRKLEGGKGKEGQDGKEGRKRGKRGTEGMKRGKKEGRKR